MSVSLAQCIVCILFFAAKAEAFVSIVGYGPTNDVEQHLRLDIDQRNLTTAVSALDLATAYKAYSVGKSNDVKMKV